MTFNEKTSSKIEKTIENSENLYNYLQQSLATNILDKSLLMSNIDLSITEINQLEEKKNRIVSKTRKIITCELVFGIGYCYFHSKKLIRMNFGILKSISCLGGYIFIMYSSLAMTMLYFKLVFQKECDLVYIKKYFLSDCSNMDDNDLKANKLRDLLGFYKRMKYINSKMGIV